MSSMPYAESYIHVWYYVHVYVSIFRHQLTEQLAQPLPISSNTQSLYLVLPSNQQPQTAPLLAGSHSNQPLATSHPSLAQHAQPLYDTLREVGPWSPATPHLHSTHSTRCRKARATSLLATGTTSHPPASQSASSSSSSVTPHSPLLWACLISCARGRHEEVLTWGVV